MLPKRYRITKEKDFKKINTTGRSFFSSDFRLRSLVNKTEISRFAIVVSTKVSKKATLRNRLRRQVGEIIRDNQKKVKQGVDVVISANSKALKKDYQQLEKGVLSLLNKAKLLE